MNEWSIYLAARLLTLKIKGMTETKDQDLTGVRQAAKYVNHWFPTLESSRIGGKLQKKPKDI